MSPCKFDAFLLFYLTDFLSWRWRRNIRFNRFRFRNNYFSWFISHLFIPNLLRSDLLFFFFFLLFGLWLRSFWIVTFFFIYYVFFIFFQNFLHIFSIIFFFFFFFLLFFLFFFQFLILFALLTYLIWTFFFIF